MSCFDPVVATGDNDVVSGIAIDSCNIDDADFVQMGHPGLFLIYFMLSKQFLHNKNCRLQRN